MSNMRQGMVSVFMAQAVSAKNIEVKEIKNTETIARDKVKLNAKSKLPN